MAINWAVRFLPLLALLASAVPSSDAAAQVEVQRTVAGRLIAAGGGDVRDVRVFARAGALADSMMVDSAGRFSFVLPKGSAKDSVELWVDAADPAARAFHPARLRLSAREAAREHEIVLVPLRWTVRGGRYAGREVEVRLERAFTGVCATCSGFFRRMRQNPDSGRTRLQGWPAERFPLRVAFDREWSGEIVTSRDSVAFWRETEELEETFGADVFRPANFDDAVPRGDGPEDVILVWFDPDLRGTAGVGTAVSNGHDIEYGDLRLNRGALREGETFPGLVAHELMHTLGFGHTCAWRSVLADVRRCPHLRAPTATEEDVAYVQLAAEIRALVRERRSRWALEAALAAMEAAGQGLATR